MADNIVEGAAKGALDVVRKPFAWAKAAPIIFAIFVVILAVLVLRFRDKITAFLSKYRLGKWLLGLTAVLPVLLALGRMFARFAGLALLCVLLRGDQGSPGVHSPGAVGSIPAPATVFAVDNHAAYVRPPPGPGALRVEVLR